MLPLEAAAIWSLLGGYLLLPSGTQIDLPLLPPLDKTSIPAIITLLLCFMKGTQSKPPRQSPLAYLFALAFIASPVFTSFGNSFELQTVGGSIPGFYPLDGLKYAGRNAIMLVPFFIGTHFLNTEYGRSTLLKSLPAAALVYSLPMLFEVRMSPQLHRWVYGFFPHSFQQQMRDGGFRPVVFLEHGLQVALFASMAVIAAAIVMRLKRRIMRMPAGAVTFYLGIVLLLCKTLGATLYAALMAPVVLFTRPRAWARLSCIVLLFVCAYPALRWHGLVPVQQVSSAANAISGDRSASFEMRVANEDQLLAKAQQKPLFGWGTWGRNRIYDAQSGRDISVTDGTWIIELGVFGWLGYLSLFGLLTVAVFRAYRAVGNQVTPASITLAGLSLLLGVNVIDLLPNSNLTPITFLLAGAIARAGRARATRSSVGHVAKREPQPSALEITR